MDGDSSPLNRQQQSPEEGAYASPSPATSPNYPDVSSPQGSPNGEASEGHLSPGGDSAGNSPAAHGSPPLSPVYKEDDSGDDFNASSPNIPGSPEPDPTDVDGKDSESYQPQSPSSPAAEDGALSPRSAQNSPAQSPNADDEDRGSADRLKTASDDEKSEKSSKKASTPASSDDEGNETSKRKRIVDSDDSDHEEEEGSSRRKNLLDSDDSDDDELDEEQRKKKLGNLIVNIFGEDVEDDDANERGGDDDEEDEEKALKRMEEKNQDYEDDYGDDKGDRDRSGGFEWDFDIMLREKKAEKKRKRKRKDAGIDIINDDDGVIAHMVNAMKTAAKDDRHSNTERKPALKKRKMLHDVKMMLLRMDMLEAMIDGGMMSAVSEWLAPLPDKSLPALEIRTELLKILTGFGNLDQGVLKQSGLGRAVMLLYKHPRETKENKAMAAHIIREWSRPIFQLETDFRSVSREERVQRDFEHMSSIKKRRLSSEAGPSDASAASKTEEKQINRARVPRPSTKDYVVRPKPLVEGEFKGERKGKAFARLDKTQRDFLERTKRIKAKRAVTVSLEGRNMAL